MTKQIPDKVFYHDQEYLLAGLKGNGLLTPKDFGINPTMMTTACYRGYFCNYTCFDHKLYLTELTVRSENGQLPEIDGISAVFDNFPLAPRYLNLQVPCLLTGGLIIVRNPTERRAFPNPIEFKEVWELIFQNGELQSEIDHSSKISDLRLRVNALRGSIMPDAVNEVVEASRIGEIVPEKRSQAEQEKLQQLRSKMQFIYQRIWSFAPGYIQQPGI